MKKFINLSLLLFTIHLFLIAIFAQTEQKAELVVQTGHSDTISSVKFSPNGKILVSRSKDKTIKFWDVESGKLLKTLPLSEYRESINFNLDGKILKLTRASDKTIKLWDLGSDKLVKNLSVSAGLGTLSPNGKMLASASLGGCEKNIQIWDVDNDKLLRSISYREGECNSVGDTDGMLDESVIFSPDGNTLLTNEMDNQTIRLWDVNSGTLLNTISESGDVSSVAFSPDGKTVLSSTRWERTSKLWDVKSGELLKTILDTDSVYSVSFSPDGTKLASGANNGSVKLWDIETSSMIQIFVGHSSYIKTVTFSPDGKTIVSAGKDKSIKLWDVQTGKEVKNLSGYSSPINLVTSSFDGKTLASIGRFGGKIIKLWDIKSGRLLGTLKEHLSPITSMSFSPGGKLLASSGGHDKTIKLWDADSGRELKTLSDSDYIGSVTFSPDGKIIASTGGFAKTIKLWDVESGALLKTLYYSEMVLSITFSADGKKIALAKGHGETIKIWDVESGNLLQTLTGHTFWIDSAEFSSDGKILASSQRYSDEIKLWDVETGKELKSLSLSKSSLSNIYHSIESSLNFSSDDKLLGFGEGPYTIRIWSIETGKELKVLARNSLDTKKEISKLFPELFKEYYDAAISDKYIAEIYENDKIKLFDKNTYEELASLISLGENEWAVVTPNGLYDSSIEARKLMHYVIGFEPISLEQMKDLYYVPGLLQKIFKGEPLPKVELFSKKDLFPDVEFSQPAAGQKDLKIKLTNRGGGIGQVQVLVNGKEFVKDARPRGLDVNAKQAVRLSVSLKDAPFIAGRENKIEVVARNVSGSLTNRGTARGTQVFKLDGAESRETPNIYAIVGGVSNYTGDNLKLNFAAKDAEDFAKAIEVGAVKLLGDKAKVHIRLLTSGGANSSAKFDVPDAKISTATKADFERAFADFRNATPNDVFIVYLAGHGVSLNLNQNPTQAGGDTYLYLTQEATTTDKSVLSIENSRRAMAISSEELKDLMKQNKALKQVLILDTCAAGALSNSLVAKRDLPSDQIRAIERLKDNTGFYVLMGSSADAVSYEASQYGQGLLTYSLLQGMKGARLRENQFADVNLLFAYSQETVPNMAKNIGGIQRPLIITPDTSASFDIGKFTSEEQQRINLSNPKPIFLRPNLRNSALRFDNLKLSQMMSAELRQMSYVQARDAQSPIVFVEADEMTDAILISGDYTTEGDTLKISVILVKDNQTIGKEFVVTGKLNESEKLIKQIVEIVTQSLQ